MAGKTIGELSESVSLDNTNLLAVSSDGNVLKKTTLSTLENSLTASNFNATSKATIAGLAMPSSRYIDLTLGASGATYTAPADGYFEFVTTNGATQNHYTYLTNETAQVWYYTMGNAGIVARGFIPAEKNQLVSLGYFNSTIASFRFVYATGSEPTA